MKLRKEMSRRLERLYEELKVGDVEWTHGGQCLRVLRRQKPSGIRCRNEYEAR